MKNTLSDLLQAPLFSWIVTRTLWVIGIIFVLTVTFLSGEALGYHKASFSYMAGENYNRIFGDRHISNGMGGTLPLPPDNTFANPHGAFGRVVKVVLPEVVISGSDGTEKTILLTNTSIIKLLRDDAASTSIAVGDTVIVIGNPDDQGRTVASLLRIIPATQ